MNIEKIATWLAIAVIGLIAIVSLLRVSPAVVGGVTWDKEIFQNDVDIKGSLDVDEALTLTGVLTGSAGIAGTKICIDNGSSSYSIIDFSGNTTTPTYSTSTSCQ
jgi:hypothetical protein